MTLVVLPSMMATHELVVPRSMPMILPMVFLLRLKDVMWGSCGWFAVFQGAVISAQPR
jgi:hypothetical protein